MSRVLSNQSLLEKKVSFALVIALAANIMFWLNLRDMQAQWSNVPPAPKEQVAAFYGLGDETFAYRINALMLQNLGDTGGRVTMLRDYDYNSLSSWFFLQDKLDPKSDFMPHLAAYYFGNVQEPEKYRPVLEYLKMVGARPEGIKWNWLYFAVYYARHKLNDLDKALELANVLAQTKNPNVPDMVRNMAAYVMNAKGTKREAYIMLVESLKANMYKMKPENILSTRAFICEQILDASEAKDDPLCEGL